VRLGFYILFSNRIESLMCIIGFRGPKFYLLRIKSESKFASLRAIFDLLQDGPQPSDGDIIGCLDFKPFNTSSPLSFLSTPPPYTNQSIATWYTDLTYSSGIPTSNPIFINMRGLGSSGIVEFVGLDSPESVWSGGREGSVLIDVIVRYNGASGLNGMGKVCSMFKRDESEGLGIYVSISDSSAPRQQSEQYAVYVSPLHC
jgi:hypothetical protein